jgi:serine/threonine-protein kinase
MVALQLSCPGCHTHFVVGSDRSGQRIPCPGCGRKLRIPFSSGNPRWYCLHQGQRSGPLSLEDVRKRIAAGTLLSTDQVRQEGTPAWALVSSVEGLLPKAAPEPAHSDADNSIFDQAPTAEERIGPLSMRGMRPRPLRSITLGDYQILKKLGGGAMGAVYLAQQRSRNCLVALKVLSRQLSTQFIYVQRFYREAEMMATLDHPNLVRLQGVGSEHDFHYFAMEHMDSGHAGVVRQRLGENLSVGDVLYIVRCAADALRYAHEEHQIIHRDVKPSNILLNHLGHVKVSDLGLAKPLVEDLSLTESGVGVGTPEYMSPEQMRDAKRADHRSDIYALGGVLYYLLTGALPFQAEGFGDLLLVKERGSFVAARRKNRHVPERLDLMVDRMLARDVRNRYQTYTELLRDLDRVGLAHAHLSFNLYQMMRDSPPDVVPVADRVEVLLIHDDAGDILLSQEALDESGIPSNLNVVAGKTEALAFLTRDGKYTAAPRPDLILLAQQALDSGGLDLVAAIKKHDHLRMIPLLILTDTPRTAEALQTIGNTINLKAARADQDRIQELFQDREGGSTIVVVVRP